MSESSLYVSFHGGTGAGTWNNIHAYEAGGDKIGKALDKSSLSKQMDLRELRGFEVGPDGGIERRYSVEEELEPYLSEEERADIAAKSKKPTQILSLQSTQLRELKMRGLIEDFRHMEMQNVLVELYALQGKSERIKNFPYPRQYATLNSIFLWIFILLVPFGVMFEFDRIGEELKAGYPVVGSYFVWLSVPFSAMVMWVFHTMERIGRVSENPFEGKSMDIPITTISRGIEIDLREMLNETPASIPAPIEPQYDTQT